MLGRSELAGLRGNLYAVPIVEATARRVTLDLPANLVEPMQTLLIRVRRQAWHQTGSARATARIEAGVLQRCETLIAEQPTVGVFMLEQRVREFAARETELYQREARHRALGRLEKLGRFVPWRRNVA